VKLNYLDTFSKNTENLSLIKIRPVGAELFHTDGQTYGRIDKQICRHTDRYDKLIVAFSNFANAIK